MFVRINKSGERRYLQVVESYRNEDGKPRHRVVANLGRVDGMRIPEHPPTHSDNMRPPIPGYSPTCDALP